MSLLIFRPLLHLAQEFEAGQSMAAYSDKCEDVAPAFRVVVSRRNAMILISRGGIPNWLVVSSVLVPLAILVWLLALRIKNRDVVAWEIGGLIWSCGASLGCIMFFFGFNRHLNAGEEIVELDCRTKTLSIKKGKLQLKFSDVSHVTQFIRTTGPIELEHVESPELWELVLLFRNQATNTDSKVTLLTSESFRDVEKVANIIVNETQCNPSH